MQEILDFCKKHDIFIISDEVYWNESFPKVKFTSFAHVTKDVPVIIVGGMEKTFLVPGWSISWIIFADPTKTRLDMIRSACLATS
jgi:aspartate/methionine/tyrosine aminotransferase